MDRILNLSEVNKLLLLFLLAFIIRAIGVNYGYLFGDERINDAAKALSGQLVPGQHFYPPLLNYLTAVAFGILYCMGRVLSIWYDLADFRAQYFSDPTPFYITARLLVAFIAAGVAPLFYLIAREVGINKQYSLLAGLFGVFIPGMVLLSHIAKSDIPLAACGVLVVYVALKKMKAPNSTMWDLLLGLSISLALSFKQSYIFILIPSAALFAFLFYQKYQDLVLLGRSALFITLAALISGIIFNIGILLDFQNFLDYQKIQSVMSIRETIDLSSGIAKWWEIMSDTGGGINFLVVLLFFTFPFFIFRDGFFENEKWLLFSFWGAVTFATFMVIYLSGGRQQPGLWVPYMVLMQLFVALMICIILQHKESLYRSVGLVLAVVVGLLSVFGSFVVMKQALAKPIIFSVEEFLNQNYKSDNTKMIVSITMHSPQTQEMRDMDQKRSERLAKKYKVKLPEQAAENLVARNDPDAINYYNLPVAFWGLENTDDDTLGEAMKAHNWPLQKEEWKLDYWLKRGFSVFVLGDRKTREASDVALISNFYKEVSRRCKLVKNFEPTKPLFVEFTATIFKCPQS